MTKPLLTNFKHSKTALQLALLAEAIAANPNPTTGELDDIRYFYQKLERNILEDNISDLI